ncbi:MAG: hypothetical protein LC122_03995 [Chitinophagales bacterium]|nr:hypothetical protein [Chitinophagales bacterium]
MKKTLILTLISSFMLLGKADAQLSKLKNKLTGGGRSESKVENVTGDVTGSYTAIKGVEVKSGFGTKKLKNISLKLDADKNEIEFSAGKDKMKFVGIDKTSKKMKMRVWRADNPSNKYWLIELEPEVIAIIEDVSVGNYELKGKGEKVDDVLAKDASKLSTWDIETAQAKYEAVFSAANKKEANKIKDRLIEDYPIYKKYMGKAVFANKYTVFNYSYVDKPTDDEKGFVKTAVLGDPIYLAAYFSNSVEGECGSDCELDIVYEMGGVTVSRVDLRKDKTWQKDIKQLQGGRKTNMFCYNHGHSLWNPSANAMDYAFWYCLYQNKPKFKEGGKYEMKVSFYTSRDGNRGAKLAEGSITFTYDAKSQEKMRNPMGAVRDLVED